MDNEVKVASTQLADIMHNVRVKTYPSGLQEISCASEPVYREAGWELSDKWTTTPRGGLSDNSDSVDNLIRAQRRARMAIRDIALSNEFKYFVTLTLDASKVDRYDITAQTKRMNTWLDNRVRRCGLKYVLVPELHKDGAIHYHGFINDALSVIDSGTLQSDSARPRKPRSKAERSRLLASGAHVVYNLPDWKFGFSTAIEIYGDYRKAVSYVCKYINKQQQKIGGRWYYSGGDLQKPFVTLSDIDIDEFMAQNGSDSPTFSRAGIDFCVAYLGGDL